MAAFEFAVLSAILLWGECSMFSPHRRDFLAVGDDTAFVLFIVPQSCPFEILPAVVLLVVLLVVVPLW